MIVLDLMPWSTVNNPGFLRNQNLSTPNFELASDKYYRDMLSPSYCKIKTALKIKLEVDNPIVVSLALDAWSAQIVKVFILPVFHSMNATLHITFIKK